MLNSAILDVIIGLIFAFLTVSLGASSAVEALASALKWRSETLLDGIKALVNDPDFTGLAKSLYNHALVNPQSDGEAKTEADLVAKPAYIDPQHFADALIEVTNLAQTAPDAIKAEVAKIGNAQLKKLLGGIVDRSAGDVAKMRSEISRWFDNSMDRVSGVYKRKSQAWSFALALAIATLLNIDAISITKILWQQPMLATKIELKTGPDAPQAIAQLDQLGLPIGWSATNVKQFGAGWGIVGALLGWLVTAAAALFGAPFWFDTLQTIIRLKGAGPSPREKAQNIGASS